MIEKDILQYDDNKLFNNDILQQYDEDGQKGFLGFLLRYEKWKIEENKIIFPKIKQKDVENLLKYYESSTRNYNLMIKRKTLDGISIFGIGYEEKTISDEEKKIRNIEKQLKNNFERD